MTHPQSQSPIFTSPESLISAVIPRLVIQLEALDKCGKTHWSLFTPPDPITLITNDPGTVIVLKKALAVGRRIPNVMQLVYPDPDPNVTKKSDIDTAAHTVWRKELARVQSGIVAVVNERPGPNRTRTLVFDTATDLWNLFLLAHFGKTQKIQQNMRTACNADYTKMFWDLYRGRPDLNMVFITKLKKEYKPNSKGEEAWTGQYEPSGFNQSGFLVDICVRAGWDPVVKGFYTELQRVTRYGADLVGKRWTGVESGFASIALDVFPETVLTPEIWGL